MEDIHLKTQEGVQLTTHIHSSVIIYCFSTWVWFYITRRRKDFFAASPFHWLLSLPLSSSSILKATFLFFTVLSPRFIPFVLMGLPWWLSKESFPSRDEANTFLSLQMSSYLISPRYLICICLARKSESKPCGSDAHAKFGCGHSQTYEFKNCK